MKATKPTAPPSTRGARPTTPPAEAPGKAPSRIGATRSLRELLESLSLAAQFRLVVVVSVIVTMVVLHATMALVEVGSARNAAIDSVRQSADAGADLIDVLGRRFDVSSVSITLPSGEILGQYVRTAASTHEAAGASVASVASAQTSRGWWRRVGEALALQPTVLSLPVQMGS